MKKKLLSLLLCMAMLYGLTGCGSSGGNAAPESFDVPEATDAAPESGDATEATDAATESGDAETEAANPAAVETRLLRLGSSLFAVTIPKSFVTGELTEDDLADDQVAYYHSEETLMDFDVYQFSKEGYPDTLAEFVTAEAAEYNATEVVTDAELNGIAIGYYRSVEKSGGVSYNVITYAFEDNGEYVEMAFWLDGDTAEEEANAIIHTLTLLGTHTISLGSSAFSLTIPADFTEGEMSAGDIADDQVAYYHSEATPMDFDVYQFSKEGYPDTLAEFVAAEAAQYEGTDIVTDAEINGITVASYRSVEASEGASYNVITYAFEDNGEYVEVAFWLDGLTAQAEADAIISTLKK
ncbi:MAG: hypothetical protein IKR84_00060 [Oscillibacter sp.]|nr:hypothetical protein [Oscillibacter sp.]